MYSINLPLTIETGKTKKFSLNLNQYRNTHYFLLNQAKINFHGLVGEQLKDIPPINKCVIEYTLYLPTQRKVDISNVCSIVDKFFCDTLVEYGILEDDNYTVIPEIKYQFGSVDKTNPRVVANIIPLN